MPDINTFKLMGTKLVPVTRFNLEPAKPSSAFSVTAKPIKTDFLVVEHPVVHSINIDPVVTNNVFAKEHFPLIEQNQIFDKESSFIDYNNKDVKLVFPDIEISPNNNTVFYYENIFDGSTGKVTGLMGYVCINYNIRNKSQLKVNEANIEINLKEASLNLKVKKETNSDIETVKINGIIDSKKGEILFNLKDEAVKIAFTNLITGIPELKCSIDLFFDFKAFYKTKKTYLFARNILSDRVNLLQPVKTMNRNIDTNQKDVKIKTFSFASPMIVKENSVESKISRDKIKEIQIENNLKTDLQEEYIKSTFLLKVNKILEYNLTTNYFKTIANEIITSNPFNLNPGFSQFKQIFVPGIDFNRLSIYKSIIQPNTFLLISKVYCLTRTNDTLMPCISTIFHLYEDGTSLSEDISKIDFEFSIGPNLSEFDLAKLKIDLHNHNFLDNEATGTTDYLNSISFLYPNDIDSNYEISGNHFLQSSSIAIDGKRFHLSISTENLNDASLLINAINNSISQYANINFNHKEIKDTSIIELNIQKTIGEIIFPSIDTETKKINIENKSVSKCKLNSVLFIDMNNSTYFNTNYFLKFQPLNSNDKKELSIIDINPEIANISLKNVFFDFESIEDISSEFKQIVSQSTNYSRYITINIKTQKTKIAKIQIELVVIETGNKFYIEKLKSEFSTPVLFNIIIKNSAIQSTIISCKTDYFDQNGNIVGTTNSSFDFSSSAIINITKLN